jgi:predicted esterase YcpF (UPF0227 family)
MPITLVLREMSFIKSIRFFSQLDRMGGVLDDAFLALPKILRPFRPKMKMDLDVYAGQIGFYFDNGYADNPAGFFKFPHEAPIFQIPSETACHEGLKQIITFQSQYVPVNPEMVERFERFEENKTAYLIRWTHGDQGRKTLICLHGYLLGDPDQAQRMFKIRKLFQMGMDVALFITPFHWKRAPKSVALRGMFLQPEDVAMTCECFGQAMFDLYHSLLLLRKLGAKEIGIIGASLGGYNAGLIACLTDKIAFAAMMVPAVKFTDRFGPESISVYEKMDAELKNRIQRLWNLHSPLNFMPKIPKDKILIIASKGDKVCPFEPVKELCEKWGWPKHVFLTGGHWLMFNARERGRAWYKFLGEMGFI